MRLWQVTSGLEGRHVPVQDGAVGTAVETDLLERAQFLTDLGQRLEESRRAGRLVLIGGEAGVGKTALLSRFCLLHGERTATLWTEIGCPYEAALALADASDESVLRRSLEALQCLGAVPASTIVARRLRQRGVRGLQRGPRPSTRKNPARLTAREVEVLTLVAEGLRNADIAERLFLSAKTIDHHVSSILGKLGVRTRSEASTEAARLGVTPQDH